MVFLFETPQGLVPANNAFARNYTTKSAYNPDTSTMVSSDPKTWCILLSPGSCQHEIAYIRYKCSDESDIEVEPGRGVIQDNKIESQYNSLK